MTEQLIPRSNKELTDEEASLRGLRNEESYLEKYGFHFPDDDYVFRSRPGLDAEIVAEISHIKGEPAWMTELRLKAYEHFLKRPMPTWGGDLSKIKFDDIYYYVRATDHSENDWDDVPADIKETFDRLGIPEAEQKFLSGAGAQYECLAGETKIYTQRGQIPIQDVMLGDIVFAYDEQAERLIPSPVTGTMAKGVRQVYKVKVGTRTIRATDNHPFLTLSYTKEDGKQRGRYTREWKYLSDLQPGDLVAVAKELPDIGQSYNLEQPEVTPKRRYKEVNLPEQTDENVMWMFGLYMGDGYIKREKTKASIEFAIPEQDPQLQAELVAASEQTFGVTPAPTDQYRLRLGSTLVANYFEQNGFTGNAHTKRVPNWVYGLPLNERLAFLGGYLDSDGYVRDHAKNRDVVFTSVHSELLEDMRQLALSCNMSTSSVIGFNSLHVYDKSRMMQGYRLMVSRNGEMIKARSERRLERMGKKKFQHSYSMAKGTDFRKHTNEYLGFVRIDSIEPDGETAVYDIEVDGPHNFVAEGLIVHNSEMVYHKIQAELEDRGVIFLSMDDGLRQHEDLVREYFTTVIPANDNKFSALNTAVWSGGSFIYVPPGVHIEMPLQAYFRINSESMGQFERTLIIVDEGASVHYVEGCTAPIYSKDSLHSAVVEIIVKPGGTCRYTTIQNWSNNVFNLVTKRAVAYRDATMEWVDANIGSQITMKYPAVHLMEPGAHGEILSIAFAGKGQHQDAGGKVVHHAPNTTSRIISKSISKDGGRASYRGLLKIDEGAINSRSNVVCDALLLDESSRSDTYPYIEIDEKEVTVGHEASVSKIGEEQLFYLMSRGLTEDQANAMIVNGFIEPLAKELPMEYSIELRKLIEIQLEGSIG